MKEINPQIRAILASGYGINGEAQSIFDTGGMAFVGKPFAQAELSLKVAQVLRGGVWVLLQGSGLQIEVTCRKFRAPARLGTAIGRERFRREGAIHATLALTTAALRFIVRKEGRQRMDCPVCGQPHKNEVAACSVCGSALQGEAQKENASCPACGASNEKDALVCTMCGQIFQREEASARTPLSCRKPDVLQKNPVAVAGCIGGAVVAGFVLLLAVGAFLYNALKPKPIDAALFGGDAPYSLTFKVERNGNRFKINPGAILVYDRDKGSSARPPGRRAFSSTPHVYLIRGPLVTRLGRFSYG